MPCSYLPMAVDAERYVPLAPDGPARTVDVASWGRRLPGTHAPLVRALAEGRLFYHFDTISGLDVTDHVEHRLVQAALLQRTRYSVVYRINDEPGRIERTGGEESLTNRYFEALAAGHDHAGHRAGHRGVERRLPVARRRRARSRPPRPTSST